MLAAALTTQTLRRLLFLSMGISLLVLLLGCGYNSEGLKYTKAKVTNTCHRNILALTRPLSMQCCDEIHHRSEWLCIASFDHFNRYLTSFHGAWLIPLLPLLCNLLSDLFMSFLPSPVTSTTTTTTTMATGYSSSSSSSYSLGKSASEDILVNVRSDRVSANLTAHLLRFILYFVIFVFRTVILYMVMTFVQEAIEGHPHSDCWYAEHLRSHSCKDAFDFSDHIVLWVAHFIIPATMEIAYAACHFFSNKGSSLISLFRFGATIFSALVIMGCAVRGILLTSMFFHTPLESVVGFGLVLSTIVVPIYILAGKPYWRACIYGGIKM